MIKQSPRPHGAEWLRPLPVARARAISESSRSSGGAKSEAAGLFATAASTHVRACPFAFAFRVQELSSDSTAGTAFLGCVKIQGRDEVGCKRSLPRAALPAADLITTSIFFFCNCRLRWRPKKQTMSSEGVETACHIPKHVFCIKVYWWCERPRSCK